MLSLSHIWTVARVEVRTLLRSWVFRIFAGLSIASVLLLNIHLLIRPEILLSAKHFIASRVPWANRAIPSSIPYINVILLNVAQAIIAVFLASNALKEVKKLDTTEAVYVRPMTNGEYIFGKVVGLSFVFLILNAVVLFVALVLNSIFSNSPVTLRAYFLYPLLIGIPTLVYVLGLSFLLMVCIRSQAFTLISLLGYIVVTIFFLKSYMHDFFDFISLRLPFLYSDFVGLDGYSEVIIHRGFYFSLGLSFLFATILLFKRLPQSKTVTNLSKFLVVFFIICSVLLGSIYLTRGREGRALRQKLIELNNNLIEASWVVPLQYEIDLEHLGDEIKCEAKLVFTNDTNHPIDCYLFNLNPGLHVNTVKDSRGDLEFERKLHVLMVTPFKPLTSGSTDSLVISYRGKINEGACYLDVDEQTRSGTFQVGYYELLKVKKRYSFIGSNYCLLTPENLWYPVAGIQFCSLQPTYRSWNFSKFRLSVKTANDLIAVSQGHITRSKNGDYIFSTEFPLPGITLAIGRYERRSVESDSIEYQLFTLVGHDYFTQYFSELGDTMSVLIREVKQEIEQDLDLPYVYRRLTLVEVPIQFFSYRRPFWTITKEMVQPEMILIPEKGYPWRHAECDWYVKSKLYVKLGLTTKEVQSQLFKYLCRYFWYNIDYNIFPEYFTYIYHLESKKWPALNMALESFLRESFRHPNYFQLYPPTIRAQDNVNWALRERSLSEVLIDPDRRGIATMVLHYKGNYLFTMMSHIIGEEHLREFLHQIFKANQCKVLDVEYLAEELMNRFQYDFAHHVDRWYNGRHLPGFIVDDVKTYKVVDHDRLRFQIRFKVVNPESIAGLFDVTFRRIGKKTDSRGATIPSLERGIYLEGGQAKEVGVVLDYQPRSMTINTFISKNLPSFFHKSMNDFELNDRTLPFEGERVLKDEVHVGSRDEIVVDNEDPDFEISLSPTENILEGILKRQPTLYYDKYVRLNQSKPPREWQTVISSYLYGKYVRSAHYIAAGEGNKRATWNVEIPENGYYEIYVYFPKFVKDLLFPWWKYTDTPYEKMDRGEYTYLVYHDEGVDRKTVDMNQVEEGWNFIGEYYLTGGNSKVELTDESDAIFVLADAVKWVKR